MTYVNVIDIRLEKKLPVSPEGRPYPETYCVFVTYVDGQPIANFDHDATDMRNLIDSCITSGELFILTCWCGDPGCAGIEQGITVRHDGGKIYWHVPYPSREFIFESVAYKTAVADSIDQAKRVIANWKADGHEVSRTGRLGVRGRG
jgi:hypothetical protein